MCNRRYFVEYFISNGKFLLHVKYFYNELDLDDSFFFFFNPQITFSTLSIPQSFPLY